jgi:hypothetical protein
MRKMENGKNVIVWEFVNLIHCHFGPKTNTILQLITVKLLTHVKKIWTKMTFDQNDIIPILFHVLKTRNLFFN